MDYYIFLFTDIFKYAKFKQLDSIFLKTTTACATWTCHFLSQKPGPTDERPVNTHQTQPRTLLRASSSECNPVTVTTVPTHKNQQIVISCISQSLRYPETKLQSSNITPSLTTPPPCRQQSQPNPDEAAL